MFFRFNEGDVVIGSSIFMEGDLVEGSFYREIVNKIFEEFVDLVYLYVISDLKCIVNLMFIFSYDRECFRVYVNVRKDVLKRSFFIFEVE